MVLLSGEYAKNLVRQINLEHPGAKTRIFTAILNGGIDGWPQRQPAAGSGGTPPLSAQKQNPINEKERYEL